MYNHQLDTFLQVADSGSFGKAAETLFISTPAIIQQINLLEDKCGFKLFIRSHNGAKLTAAGQALYQDAKKIIRLCADSLENARALAGIAENTVQIGTSLLFKCRLLPEICAKVSRTHPELKFELPSTSGQPTKENDFSDLGAKYDILEGIYCTISWEGLCNFIELMRTPICCAVAKDHRLVQKNKLTMRDLDGECIVMPIEAVSHELDAFRSEVREKHRTTRIVDSHYYGLDTFTLCEMNPYILITQPVYADIHTGLVTIPLETEYTLPYGIMYPLKPSAATKKFITAVKKMAF